MSDQPTRWWWIRHAPVTTHGGKIYGQKDVPCDTSDARAFAGLANLVPQGAEWVTSNLRRAKDTAAAIVEAGAPFVEPLIEPDFAEQSFGDWQDHSWQELAQLNPPEYKSFWQNPGRNAPPGGESLADLIARTSTGIDRLNQTHEGRDIVAVTHGGTIRAALALALDIEPIDAMAFTIDNLSLTRIDHFKGGLFRGKGGSWRIAGVNLPPT
ncbi:MAG TPA: histidine phosphatase family protein, partial [Rhodospirillales bacterium]|nr:histidine phosphatase family protein [Rhodospirillales bacterium]